MTQTPGCLILAAGSHRRFGSAKLLQPLADGRPLIQHTLDAVQASGLPMAIVYRPDDQALLDAIADYALQRIPSVDHNNGLGHSIAAGVSATAHWGGWLICLADMPMIQPGTYQAIADELVTHSLVIPEHQQLFGHPRGFGRMFFTALTALTGDVGARDLLLQHRDETCVLPIADPGILLDIDYPDDLKKLITTQRQTGDHLQTHASTTGSNPAMTEHETKPETQNASAPEAPAVSAVSTDSRPAPATEPTPKPAIQASLDLSPPAADSDASTPQHISAAESPSASNEAPEITADPVTDTVQATLPTPEPVAEPVAQTTDDSPDVAEQEPTAVLPELAEDVEVAAQEAGVTETGVTETGETEAPVEPAAVQSAPIPSVRFSELPLDSRIHHAVADMGFEYCTPIQALALPRSLLGKDVIGKAQTGTGKTAAFLITVLNQLLTVPEQEERYNGEPRALIMAPTRELAMQIEKDAIALIKHTPLTLMSIVGGMDYQKQQRRLQNEIIDIVVGTPGRMIDFIRSKDLFLSETEILVIDEADRMLDMGFIPDVKRLIRETPLKEYRQTLMFSATFTQDVLNLSSTWTRNAEHLEVVSDTVAADTVDQKVYIVTTEEKFTLLYNLITQKNMDRVIIFANRRDETRDLTQKMRDYDIKCAMLSGDVQQAKRVKVLESFREGKIRVLIATDVAGRGIHIDDITHVVNYTLPDDPEDYVHRIGRTGRAGKLGTSISFACEEDAFQLPAIGKLLGGALDCTQPEEFLLAPVPPPVMTPEKLRERESHAHRRRRPARRQSGNR